MLFEQQSSLPFVALITLVWNDDLERPLELCNAALALAQQMGSPHLMVNGGAFSALAGVRAGLLAEAASAAALSYEFARGSAMPESIDWAWALAILLDSMRERGEVEAAQELLAAAEAEGDLPGHVTFVFLLESRGRLRCAQGRLREGVEDLLESGRRWEPFGLVNPNVSAWRSEAAVALLGLGQREAGRPAGRRGAGAGPGGRHRPRHRRGRPRRRNRASGHRTAGRGGGRAVGVAGAA